MPPPIPPTSLGDQLRAFIHSRGLTPYALARAAGIDSRLTSRFLAGAKDINLGTASRIAAVLGLKLTEPTRKPAAKAVAPRPLPTPLPLPLPFPTDDQADEPDAA